MFKLISEVDLNTPPGLLIPIDRFTHELMMMVSRMDADETRAMESMFSNTSHGRIATFVALTSRVATRDPEFRAVLKDTVLIPTLRQIETERRLAIVNTDNSEDGNKPQ